MTKSTIERSQSKCKFYITLASNHDLVIIVVRPSVHETRSISDYQRRFLCVSVIIALATDNIASVYKKKHSAEIAKVVEDIVHVIIREVVDSELGIWPLDGEFS